MIYSYSKESLSNKHSYAAVHTIFPIFTVVTAYPLLLCSPISDYYCILALSALPHTRISLLFLVETQLVYVPLVWHHCWCSNRSSCTHFPRVAHTKLCHTDQTCASVKMWLQLPRCLFISMSWMSLLVCCLISMPMHVHTCISSPLMTVTPPSLPVNFSIWHIDLLLVHC